MELWAAVIRMENVVLGCRKKFHLESQVPSSRDERIVMAMTQEMLKRIHVFSQSHLSLKKVVFQIGGFDWRAVDASPFVPNVVVELEAAGNTVEFLAGLPGREPMVAVVEGDGDTSCPAVREEFSSSSMQSESMDGGRVDLGEYAGGLCISRLQASGLDVGTDCRQWISW